MLFQTLQAFRKLCRCITPGSRDEVNALLALREWDIESELKNGDLKPAATTAKSMALQRDITKLCAHDVAGTRFAQQSVQLYIAGKFSTFLDHWSSLLGIAAITDQVLIITPNLLDVLDEQELRAVAAHELAHIINGDLDPFNLAMLPRSLVNQRMQRAADRTAAALLNYDVEPLIKALLKIDDLIQSVEQRHQNPYYQPSRNGWDSLLNRSEIPIHSRVHSLRHLVDEEDENEMLVTAL